jgi:hypothetical protein
MGFKDATARKIVREVFGMLGTLTNKVSFVVAALNDTGLGLHNLLGAPCPICHPGEGCKDGREN